MKKMDISNTRNWYEDSYKLSGFDAQRSYPNEELLRFIGRNYFCIPYEERSNYRILEIGCGSCANLWMVSREGFAAYGIDLSETAIEFGKIMIKKWGGTAAELKVGSMTHLPYKDDYFDAVLDVFSSYCLDKADYALCLSEVTRVLKPKVGKYFCYTPGKGSGAFQFHKPATMIDDSTLNGIVRNNSPFSGNHYPFRFIHPEELDEEAKKNGLEVCYLETVQRSYFNRSEIFEHVVLEGVKK